MVDVTPSGRTPSDMPGLDIAEMRSWQNFLEATLRLSAKLNRELMAAHKVTLDDVRLLHALATADTGHVRMGALADALLSTPSRVSRQMDRLAARTLVSRLTSEKDGRYVLATITGDGRAVLSDAMASYAGAVRMHYLGPLSRAQTAAMAENCRRINAALTPQAGPAKPGTRERGSPSIHSVS